jgi:hypothetical protein
MLVSKEKIMKIISILVIIPIIGCGPNKDKFQVFEKKCVVDSIYEVQRSTIEFDKKYSVITDCGEYPITSNNLRIKKGDTVIFSKTFVKK